MQKVKKQDIEISRVTCPKCKKGSLVLAHKSEKGIIEMNGTKEKPNIWVCEDCWYEESYLGDKKEK